MSISSQKVVSKPIGLHEVADLLHVKAVDVGAVCCAKDKINPWSKHKPLDSSIYPELTEEQMAAVNYGLDLYQCAVGTMNGQNVGGGIYAIDQLGVQAQTWVYHSPADSSTAKYRLTDFNKYKHKGQAYRWPVRFYPVHTLYAGSAYEVQLLRIYQTYPSGNWNSLKMSWTIPEGYHFYSTSYRAPENTRCTYTGIHIASWGYAGLTTRIEGYSEIYLVDANGRRVSYSKHEFTFRQSSTPDQWDSLNRVGISIDFNDKVRGKGPWTLHMDTYITDVVSTCQTSEKGQLEIQPLFGFAGYDDDWSTWFSLTNGFAVRIPECSGDWAENNHSYEKELLHYTDVSTGETVYCTDPMFIMSLEDDNNNNIGNRYWFPSGNIGNFITPWLMGFGAWGDLRQFKLTGLYMFYCNKEKVYRAPSGGVAANDAITDTINTTNTVIFPAPYCKWDWDSIKKS